MQKLAAGKYHPAVRVNAMLMIGELNRVEQPPTPLPEALAVMIAAVQSSKLSDAVRATAMVGIKRHVAAGIADEDVRKTLTAALLKVAADGLPTGTARDGREWILRQAIDILGRLGSVGENNAVFTLLSKTLSDSKLPLKTRTAAADALGRLSYSGATGINPADVAAMLGQLAIDACTEELRQAKNSDDPISRPRLMERLMRRAAGLGGRRRRQSQRDCFAGRRAEPAGIPDRVAEDHRERDRSSERQETRQRQARRPRRGVADQVGSVAEEKGVRTRPQECPLSWKGVAVAKFAVILPAAGRSSRFRDQSYKKPFAPLANKAVWLHSAERFLGRNDVVQTILVIATEDRADFNLKFSANIAILGIEVIDGGAERADSVEAALARVKPQADFVCVHDAARPCLADAVDRRHFRRRREDRRRDLRHWPLPAR